MTAGGLETDPVEFRLKPEVLRSIFDSVAAEVQRERKNIEAARAYLISLEADGDHIYIRHVMERAVREVSGYVG